MVFLALHPPKCALFTRIQFAQLCFPNSLLKSTENNHFELGENYLKEKEKTGQVVYFILVK